MDQAQGPQYSGSEGHNEAHNYTYAQPANNDPFNSFIHTEDEAAFDNTWQAPELSIHNPPSNNYEQPAQHWPQNAFTTQSQTYMPLSPYGLDPRYSTPVGPNLQYASFGTDRNQPYPGRPDLQAPAFNDHPGFRPNASNDENSFPYSRPASSENTNQTISPTAITTYADLGDLALDKKSNVQPSQKFSGVPSTTAFAQNWGGSFQSPLTIQDWRQLATKSVKSIDRFGLHIKPTDKFENVTQTKRFSGFVFVGSGQVAVNVNKANTPRYKRKRSRNELTRMLETERGEGPRPPEREHILKKLKGAAKKQSGPRPAATGTQLKSASSSDVSSESATDDSSSAYDSESEPEKEADEPSPIPSTRPNDPNKAVEYDLLKAVWAKRSSVLSTPTIRTALAEVWELFKGIREKWKTRTANLQQAIDKKDSATEKSFERRVAEQRRLLENCINIVLKHGHPSIVEKISENPVQLLIFCQFLRDRFNQGETSGSFVTSILELMAKSPSLNSSHLEQTKLDKLLQRLLKRGDDRGKALVQKILEAAKPAEKAVTTSQQPNGEARKPATHPSKAASAIDSAKEIQAARKPSIEKTISSIKPSKAQGVSSEPRAPPKIKSESNIEAKTKVVNVAAKPSGFFSNLKSASKRPGTSTKVDDSGKIAAQERKPDVLPPAQKPAFSFAATMAGLAKQKDETPSKTEEARKPETPEERQKRERKESRRQLRVSFKGEDELVEIRTFVHFPEEEIGHDQSQVRDVGDSKGEGQMLKMHKDLELDDDEDYEPPEELPPSWSMPMLTDFSDIAEDDRNRHFWHRGGVKEFDAAATERDTQISREDGTLMAMYPTLSDIPSTPREPLEAPKSEWVAATAFGEPPDDKKVRSREASYIARVEAQKAPNKPATPDISALLSIISNPPKKQPQQPPQPQYPVQQPTNPSNPLTSILAQISQNPHTQAAQPAQQPPLNIPFNLQAALAGMQQPQQSVPPQAPWTQPQPAANPAPNLQAILSQIGQQGVQPPVPPMQGYGYGNNQSGFPINEDRKRQMESDDNNEQNRKRPRGGKPFTGTRKIDDLCCPMNHLIIVCCHAIWAGGLSDGLDPKGWHVESFQKGETGTFRSHIQRGLQCLREDQGAIIIFSGRGATKQSITPLFEGQSYLELAIHMLGSEASNYTDRMLAENSATDSYQNLLFSILLFRHHRLRYPKHITIVSHDFKKSRFLDLHCKAIEWPRGQVTYVGIDPPPDVTPRNVLDEGEARAVNAWKIDPYGAGHELSSKRAKRGWQPDSAEMVWIRSSGVLESEVKELLAYDGGSDGNAMFAKPLPWTVFGGPCGAP